MKFDEGEVASAMTRYGTWFFRKLLTMIISIVVFCLFCNSSYAVPAYPYPITAYQPNGQEILIQKVGDEFSHSVEDVNGYTILQDEDSQYWVYAELNAEGCLRQTSHIVGTIHPSKLSSPRHLRSIEGVKKRANVMRQRTISTPWKSSKTGTVKNLVLLVAFQDKPFTFSSTEFNDLFNKTGYSYGGAHGSVKDYYKEVSYGNINIESIIAGPVTLSKGYAYYGANDNQDNDARPREMVAEALELLNATGFDFSQVDGDGDGWVDGFDVIHSGYDEAAYSDKNCIWSHNWEMKSIKTYGGVSFLTYHTEAEVYVRDGKKGITAIGVPCHETGHFLGLPDLYDPDYTSSGIGSFCLMSGGSWCDNGLRPAHMSAWCKEYLGWVTPTEIVTSGKYSLPRVEDNAKIYKIRGLLPLNEYFLLENRQGCLFDSAIPGTKRGMLIWHIDNSLNVSDNSFNTNPKHFGCDLEEASGVQNLEKPISNGSIIGDDLDYFRADNMSSFTSTTTPNSNGYSGIGLGFDIKDISASSSTMTFVVTTIGMGIDINPNVKDFDSSSGNGTFSVTANSSWTVSKSATSTWITLNTTRGSGNGTVSYSVDANTTGSERKGIITVTCGSNTATHEVTQSAEPAKLKINPPTSDVSNIADSGSFSVEANYSWTVSTLTSWIHLDTTRGSGDGTVSYSVDENTGGQRSGTITVTSGSLTATHKVTQAAQPSLSISPSTKTFSAASGSCSIAVTSDSMWTVTKSATWISLDKTSGTGNGTITYTVSKNTGSKREGWIYVTCGSVKRTHVITQNRADSVTFSKESATVPYSGGSGSFMVTILANNLYISTSISEVSWASWSWSHEKLTEGYRYTCNYNIGRSPSSLEKYTIKIPITVNNTTYYFTITQGSGADTYRVTYSPGIYCNGFESYNVKTHNKPLTLADALFRRTDYTQQGWATSDGGGKVYELRGMYTQDKSITLYPYWQRNPVDTTTYTVVFNPGTYGKGGVRTIMKQKNISLKFPEAIYTREGYGQTGWSIQNAGTSKDYELGAFYSANQSIELYPYWTRGGTTVQTTYSVFFLPGTKANGNVYEVTKRSGVALKLLDATYEREGYEQKGWSTRSDGTTKAYDLCAIYTTDKVIYLYPYWEQKIPTVETVNVIYSPGTYGEGKVQQVQKVKGNALKLPGAIYTRSGYEQTGWSLRRVGDRKTYELYGQYTNDEERYLYPYWTAVAPKQVDFGFDRPSGWKHSTYICSTNTQWWSYAPKYVYSADDVVVLNYCIINWDGGNPVSLNDRTISIIDQNGKTIYSEQNAYDKILNALDTVHFRVADNGQWLKGRSPGNYGIKVAIDPERKLNDINVADNTAKTWFAVKADDISLNEALDCSDLVFTTYVPEVFPQTSESIVGGSCVQLGPQPTNTWRSIVYSSVSGSGTLSFRWKAISDDYTAFLAFHLDGSMVKYLWATKNCGWNTVTIELGEGAHDMCWQFCTTYNPAPDAFAAGWLDSVAWNNSVTKPTFKVDSSGTLTEINPNGVTSIVIPDMVEGKAVRNIGIYACQWESSVESVLIPNSVTNIAKGAFRYCLGLRGVTIPGSVRSIGDMAFYNCATLKSLSIAEGVERIGDSAFYGCGDMQEVRLPSTIVSIEETAFSGCRLLRNITVADGNRRYECRNGSLVDIGESILLTYPIARKDSTYQVPDGIIRIADSAFSDAFNLCAITLPASVSSIGDYGFFGCTNLTDFTFLGDAPAVKDNAFDWVASGCKVIVSPQSSGWGVSIPGSWHGLNIKYSYELCRFAVSYNAGSGTEVTGAMEMKLYGNALPLMNSVFSRIGYEQTGWAVTDGGEKVYELDGSYVANEDVSLYPYWTANTYALRYELVEGTAGETYPPSATYGTPFRVSAPTRDGYVFMGWMVTSGLDITTARYGESSSNISTTIDNASQQCFNGSDVDVWFINLTSVPDSEVVLTATWEEAVDDRRDIGFYAPANKGWTFPICLSSTNIEYLAYAPETEFVQGMGVYLNFCAVNWNKSATAILQSTLLTFTDENGNVIDEGESIQRYTLGAYGYQEIRNISLDSYLDGVAPGRYKLTAELDPNRILNDPDRSNNTTSIWFVITASADPIPELPSTATSAAVATALAGSADPRLAENITDAATYSAYREWAQTVKGTDGKTAAGKQAVKDSAMAWLSFALGTDALISRPIISDDISIDLFQSMPNDSGFTFAVSIAGVGIGKGVTITNVNRADVFANLAKALGCEGSETLDEASFSSDKVDIVFEEPIDGKARFSARRRVPHNTSGQMEETFFMRVKVK